MKRLTIIIPTHERAGLLNRALEYYLSWDVSLIICDSSRKSNNRVAAPNVTYLHCPDLAPSLKILRAVELVQTPYCCMCADDDFLALSGVQTGLNFLDTHTDYVSVQGHYLSFKLYHKVLHYSVQYENVLNFHIDDELPAERIVHTFNPYMQHWYSVHRTWVMQRCLKVAAEVRPPIHSEVCSALISMIYGKHRMLPVLWMARDSNVYAVYTGDADDVQMRFITDYKTYLMTEEGRHFRSLFSQAYSEGTAEQVERGCEVFDQAFAAFFEYINNSEVIHLGWRDVVKQFIPEGFLKFRRKYLYTPSAIEKLSIAEHKETPGFPWNDASAAGDWERMKAVILKHDSLISAVGILNDQVQHRTQRL